MSGSVPAGFFDALRAQSFGPGWDKPTPSLYPEPKRDFVPYHWRFREARAFLHDAGGFVSVEFAERRNLICVNPHEGNDYGSTTNLVAAYQMVLPHESPRAHHHTPNALRVALEVPEGTYTVVDGTRIDMGAGDVLLTPNWRWHGHGNDSDAEAYWIDVLDVPLVQHLGPMFFETHPDLVQTIESTEPDSPMRLRTARIAAEARARGECRAPLPDGGALRSIGLEVLALPGGAATDLLRTTANNIYVTLGGEAAIASDDGVFACEYGDVVAMPGWRPHTVTAATDATVLRVSDAPLLERLGLLRTAAQ